MNEIYIKITYKAKFSLMLNIYACESCHKELKLIKIKILTNIYNYVIVLIITDRDHDNYI
jgi:hypothetical protein